MKGRLAFLIFLLLVISAFGQPTAGSAPPHDAVPLAPPNPTSGVVVINGDWNVSAYTRFLNATIYLTGNLSVEVGGNLEFVNTTLAMNLSANGQYRITVKGVFTMADIDGNPATQTDASMITANNTAFRYTVNFQTGSQLDFRNSIIRNCGYDGVNQGLTVSTGLAAFDGMLFQNNHYGIVIKANGVTVRNSNFSGHYYGLYSYFCNPALTNLTVTDSTARGIFLYYSKPTLADCTLLNNKIGIYFQNSEPDVISCSITGSQTAGIYTWYSSPLLVGCELSNNLEMDILQNSFPRLLNTSLDEAKVRIARGLYVSVGRHMNVSVVNQTGSPVPDVKVSVTDSQGNPASNGVTDSSGTAANLAFREKLLTREGPIIMGQHRVMAFSLDGSNVTWGENVTILANGMNCEVTVSDNPAGVEILPHGTVISDHRPVNATLLISLGDLTVNGGTLALSNSELLFFSQTVRTMSVYSGSLVVADSIISSMGAVRKLEPARILIDADVSSPVSVSNGTVRWITEFVLRNSDSQIYDLEVEHASASGLKVQSCSPRIEGLRVDWSPIGLSLSGDNSKLSEIHVERAMTYAVSASQSASTFSGLFLNNSARGLYSYYGMLNINSGNITDCDYGIYGLYTMLDGTDIQISGAVTGVYLIDSSAAFSDVAATDSSTGIQLINTEIIAESATITGNGLGLSVTGSSPVLLNCTFDNPSNILVERASSASLVNCTVDLSHTEIRPSGYIDVGHWFHVLVLDDSSQPIPGVNISVLDGSDRVSGSGMTDETGMMKNAAYREKRLYWNTTEEYAVHSILAFGYSGEAVQGANITGLSPGRVAEVRASPPGEGWIEWTYQNHIWDLSAHANLTIIAHAGIIVEDMGCLSLDNTTLWIFGNPSANIVIEVKAGGAFNMLNSRLMPLSARAPLQPSVSWMTYRASSTGELVGSRVSGINQITTYTDDILLDGCALTEMAGTGLYAQSCSPTVNGTLFLRCTDGLWVESGSPSVSGSGFIECGDYGLYASGGETHVSDSQFLENYYGIYLLGSIGYISDCIAENNDYGYCLESSSPRIEKADAVNNTDSGFYLIDSHPQMESVASRGSAYGGYLQRSWPVIFNSSFTENYNGIYAYQSAPYLFSCVLDGNSNGYSSQGDAAGMVLTNFTSGKSEEPSNFIGSGYRDHISVSLPARAIVTQANLSVRGSEIGGDAVMEDAFTQFSPEIHGEWVVWQDYRDGVWNIRAYDLSMDSDGNCVPNYLETPALADDPALFKVTDSPWPQVDPDIYEDTVIWVDYRSGEADIYAYTFTNSTEWAVCTDAGAQLKPAIDGDRIVWQDLRSGNYDVYMFNISSGETSQLSGSTDHEMGVNIHGNYVVWYAYRGSPSSGDYSDIVLFDIGAWTATNINNDAAVQYSPDVYGDKVVWHDNRNGNWEIYMHNVTASTTERLTYDADGQQNFMARIYEDIVVYYFHNQLTNLWSARMFDIEERVQTVLDRDLKGDSHPVIHGSRIAWVNRTDNKNDVYVLDLSLTGVPEYVSVDINNDGSAEFTHPGALDGREYLNGTWLADVFNNNLDRVSEETAVIPISVSANGTGRVVLGPMSLKYGIPTYFVNCTLSNSSITAARSVGSSPIFVNSSFRDNALDFHSNSGANQRTLNTSFSDSKLYFQDRLSNLTVMNYLHVRAENLSADPLDVRALVMDNGFTVHDLNTGAGGQVMWIQVTDRTHNYTGRHENATAVQVFRGTSIFPDNPRDVNMSVSHWEVFSTDPVGPEVRDPFPPPGWTSAAMKPPISVIITDNIEVDLSAVQLFVQSSAVAFTATPIANGYNISYQTPSSFQNGKAVQCRIIGTDFNGNIVNYTWEFKVDVRADVFIAELQPGWNLVSVPFDTFNASVENVLWSILGKYDSVKTYTNLEHWLGYRPGAPEGVNRISSMNRNAGYWIHATEPCLLTVSGVVSDATAVTLYAGWNLVGYPTQTENVTADVAFAGTDATMIAVFDSETPYIQDITDLASITMEPGRGYWVKVPADTLWTVDW